MGVEINNGVTVTSGRVGVALGPGVSVDVGVGVSEIGVSVGVGVASQIVVSTKLISQEVPSGHSIGSPEANCDPSSGAAGEKMRTASSL